MHRYVIALDQGTTSSRAVIFDEQAQVVAMKSFEFEQIYPQPGWVEHDPASILNTQIDALREAVAMSGISLADIAAIGITNQRETTVIWDKQTGQPLYNAIVWQCRRTAPIVKHLCEAGMEEYIKETTGLVPDAYFSGTKLGWLLDKLGLHERAKKGEICFGTIDTWLTWNLCNGHPHVTDATNASRTMLYDIHKGDWDDKLLNALGIPREVLPKVVDSSGVVGTIDAEILGRAIPVAAIAGDQHCSLFGQCCFEPGMMKNTYGTGCFLLMNTGAEAPLSKSGLVTTVAASAPGAGPEYAIEGSVFMGGALIQWIRDGLGLIQDAKETEAIALSVDSCDGVYIVPAFTGLGAPYWDSDARGAIYGLTRGTTTAHIVRAALEALAYQVYDLVSAMETDAGMPLKVLNVDGGASANNFLMQFQSDILGKPLRRPENVETTALGAAYLAGLATGFWGSLDDLRALRASDTMYLPDENDERLAARLAGWKQAVGRTKTIPQVQ